MALYNNTCNMRTIKVIYEFQSTVLTLSPQEHCLHPSTCPSLGIHIQYTYFINLCCVAILPFLSSSMGLYLFPQKTLRVKVYCPSCFKMKVRSKHNYFYNSRIKQGQVPYPSYTYLRVNGPNKTYLFSKFKKKKTGIVIWTQFVLL